MKERDTYQWVICACCSLLLFTNLGLPSSSFSVYQPYVASMVGDGNASLVVAARTGTSLVCMLLVGLWYRRFDCRLGMFLATLLTAIGFLVYSQAQDMAWLCIASAITGAGYGFGGMVGMTLLIGRWFKDHLGLAVGIATMGSGFATLAVPLVATFFISNFGLSWSFAFEAALASAVGVLLLVFLRNQPSDGMPSHTSNLKGRRGSQRELAGATESAAGARVGAAGAKERAAGATESAAGTQKAPAKQAPVLTPALKYVMFAATLMVGALGVVGQGYLSILMTTAGFDHVFAATMLSINGACLMVAKGVNGWVFDKLGRRRGSAIFFGFLIVGQALLCLTWTGSAAIAMAGSALMGVGVALATTGISVWSLDLSHPAERPALVKNMQISYALGSFLFNLAPGTLAELTGTYVTTYVLCLAMSVVSAIFVIGVYRKLCR